MERLEKAARDNKAGYTPNAGDTELRARIATELFNNAATESVVITIGAEEAMFTALLSIADPGDEILAPEPGYPAYQNIAALIGAQHTSYPLTLEQGFAIDVDALLAQVTPRTRAVIVTSPSNPTGRFAGNDTEMQRLVSELERRNIWVIDDCLYRAVAFTDHHKDLYLYGNNVITIDSISKSYACTGLRVGWLQVPKEISAKIIAVHQAVCTTAPTPSQEATKACLDLAQTSYKDDIIALYLVRKQAAEQTLLQESRIRFAAPEATFYVFADLRDFNVDTVELAFSLARKGQVVTVPGEAFGPNGAGFLRLTFTSEPAQVREGIEYVLAALKA